MIYTIQLDDTNSKAKALLEYLKTLDFVTLTDTNTDWYDDLSVSDLSTINQGLEDLKNGNFQSDFEVRNTVSQRILKASNK
jgi:hypothetical protein